MNKTPRTWPKALALLVMVLSSLYLLIGGVWLASLGGSWYYLIAGVLLAIVSVLYARNHSSSLWLYGGILLGTLLWGLWESGSDFWALAPRVDVWFLLGLWLILPFTGRQLGDAGKPKAAIATVMLAILATLAYSWFNDPQEMNGVISRAQPAPAVTAGIANEDWPAYARTQGGGRYSPLTQINEQNVKNLEVAWTYHTGDFKTGNDSGETTNQVTPIKVGNTVYICTAHQFLDAIDAKTGKRLWRFRPQIVQYQNLSTFDLPWCVLP